MSDKFDEMARECVSDWYFQTPVYLAQHEQQCLAGDVAALVRRAVEEARADEREECAKALDEHGRDRQPQYGDLYMQEVSLYARQGGSHPATVRFAARWLAAAIRARESKEKSDATR